jgi:hypothetical protein
VRIKLKMNGSMQQAVSDPATLTLPFSLYLALGAFSLLLRPINMTQDGWGSLPLFLS